MQGSGSDVAGPGVRSWEPRELTNYVVLCRRQPWPIVDRLIDTTAPAAAEVRWLPADSSDDAAREAMTSADVMMGSWVRGWPFVRADFAAAKRLRLVQLMSAGYDGLDLAAPGAEGVPVANIGSTNASTVAEHVVMLTLALLRSLPRQSDLVRQGGWRPAPDIGELRGRTFGILGMGNIGRHVAQRIRHFDATLIYHARSRLGADVESSLGLSFVSLAELLRTSDILSLNLAMTPSTRHIIGESELAQMKPSALLVNTGRGALVDEDALWRALVSGRLAGAGLDVLEREPPDRNNPLLQLDNVVVTPHQAGLSPDAWPRIVSACWANVSRAARGEDVQWRVPPT